MIFRFFTLFFLLLSGIGFAKPPQLTPRDTRIKIEEILKAHVNCHELTPEIIKRAFLNYLDEIDGSKTYFIEDEIVRWTNSSQELLEITLQNVKKENYGEFETLHEKIISAISRRSEMEKQTFPLALPKTKSLDFKNISWCKNEDELVNRLLCIRSLQLDVAEKLNQETKDQFLSRLEKRRLKHEEELITKSPREREQLVLSLVLKSITAALDSQTAYFTPSEANQFMIQVQQRLFGIGAKLRDDLNGFTIVQLLDGGPAFLGNKLKVNDKIIAVNDVPVVGMEITEAVELIRGAKGTSVQLTILRESENKENAEEKYVIEVMRGEVVLKETRLEKTFEPFGDGAIGILHLFSFYQDSKTSSAADLAMAIEELKKEHNLKAIVLDLRDNGGGLLPQAVAVTGLFIKKGIVVSVKDNTGTVQHLRNIEEKIAWDGPLLILTNKTSASAAEIVAQCLQDYGRAIVVGDLTTYGKGTFQTFTLEAANYGKVNPKGEYKVTRGCYYTVSGKSPQLVGVQSDIVVPGIFCEAEIGEKFSKYPLENDQIKPNFEDDLSDVPAIHRNQIIKLYKFNLQTPMQTYTPYLETLKNNSDWRIKQNRDYQTFLQEIAKKDLSETTEHYGKSDFQLVETVNIMKDLILLIQDDQRGEISENVVAQVA